jgi:ABC-type multidrug transport system fused ATPase/permease subunit
MALIRNITSSTPMFVGFMAFGAWMAMKGEWSVGMILPFLFWGNGFLHSINDLKGIERQINGHLPAIATLKRIMELEPAVKDLPDAIEFTADGPVRVEFRGVSFAHPGKDDGPAKTVLKDVSFKAEQGQKIAIIGPSGAGKTTLLHMLLRSRDPQGGSVHLNGFDLRGLKQSSFKRYLGYAPQNAPLFDGTIRELMLWGVLPEDRESITDEDIWKTLRVVQADFGERLDKGLDTTIGRDGIELSGGERQRLSAAIALMNPQLRLLIMDEPTSNLDWETQQGFQDGLNAALDRGVTVFMVAHRLSTVRDCDRFVVLKPVSELKDDESQVEAVASSFEELYQLSPTFRRVAKGEGLNFGPKIVTELKDMPAASASFLDGKVINLLA